MNLKKTLKQIIQNTILAGALAFSSGCELGYRDDNPNPAPGPIEMEYVDPGAADVRGTWYEHGSPRGWYGPNKEWGFGWWYFKQYGTNIEGKFEDELYYQNNSYHSLISVKGVVNGNKLSLIKHNLDGNTDSTIDAAVNRDLIMGKQHFPEEDIPASDYYKAFHMDAFTVKFRLERTGSNIIRRTTSWNPAGYGCY